MSDRRSRGVVDSSPSRPSAQPQSASRVRLRVTGREFADGRLLEVQQSFAVIGRSSRADLTFRSSKTSFRHAFLQVVDRRVLCVDLHSKTGIYWGDRKRPCGWLSVVDPVRIGPYRLRLADHPDGFPPNGADDAEASPLEKQELAAPFPKFFLELFDDAAADPVRSIDRRITLIGRDANCPVRLDDPNISRIHCALVLSPEGLWVVDLLGKGGTRLDGKPVRSQLVETGSEIAIGRYAMGLWRGRSAASTDGRATPAGERDAQQNVGVQNDGLQNDGEPNTAARDNGQSRGAKLQDWLGTLFAIEYEQEALVVIPTIRSGIFRHAKLHIELNALRYKLLNCTAPHLVLDLSAMEYVGSEVICAVVALARQTESRGGRTALCCATSQMHAALKNLGLSRIWTIYPTREAALAAVNAS